MPLNWTPEKIDRMSSQVEEAALHNRDQSASWQRWVMAASLSINGGAAAAVLNLPQNGVYDISRLWAIGWFVAGLLISIVFGVVTSIHLSWLGGYYKRQSWIIGNISTDGKLTNGSQIDIDLLDNHLKRERRIFWIQFVGLLCFLIGVGVAVEGLK